MADETEHRTESDPSVSAHLDRFGLLLCVTVVTVVLLSLVDLSERYEQVWARFGALVVTALVSATFLLALRAAGVARRWRLFADVFVGVGLVASILLFVLGAVDSSSIDESRGGAPSLLFVLLAVLAPVAIVRRLLAHRSVTRATLLGAIAAYLLIALAADLVFLAVDSISPTPFFGSPEPTTSFMYFSLITVTTLGYGDLAPVPEVGRLLAATEAIVGQVFLVTFVAMIVGLFVQSRETGR